MRPRSLFYLGILAALLVVAPVSAQQWTGSLKVGGAITNFSGDLASGNTDWDYRTGLAAGGALGYDFGNGFIPQLEATYVRKGAATDVDFNGIPARIRSDLTYLTFPLLLQYRFDTGGYVHPRLFAGPMVAFQLDAHLTFEARTDGVEITEEDDSIESRDFGAVAGAALEIDVADQRLSVEARFSFGMSDITKPDPDLGDTTLKNQGVVILVGFVF